MLNKLQKLIDDGLAFIEKYSKVIILILTLMNAFGMIAPDTATGLRDALLGLN